MHGTEHRKQERRTFCHSAPQHPLSADTGSKLPGASRTVPARDRMLVTAFCSPTTGCAFAESIPGSKLPTCHFASQPAGSSARSAFRLRRRIRFAPVPAASLPQARCNLADSLDGLRLQPPLPFGAFVPLGIKAFSRICRLSARLPNPPDLLSLPTAVFYL